MALVLLAGLPTGFAHYDSGAHPNPTMEAFNEMDPESFPSRAGTTPQNANRVSGWYYGSTNLHVEFDSTLQLDPFNRDPCFLADIPETGDVDEFQVCQDLTSPINPGFQFADWRGIGDLEVGGVGNCGSTSPLDPLGYLQDALTALNEKVVEGVDGLGEVEDGTFNDGGYGVVMHVDDYNCSPWNTNGCTYGEALAFDLMVGVDVWIATQCNWGIHTSSAAPGLDYITNHYDVMADQVIHECLNPGSGCFEAVMQVNDCGHGLASGSSPACGTSDGILCGSGTVAYTTFGTGLGTPFPAAGPSSNGVNCDWLATAAVFPLTAIVVAETGAIGVRDFSFATYGWVA